VPAICSSLSLGMQIVLTPLFMFTLGMGLAGAPAATLTGQLIGLGPRLPHVLGRRGLLRPRIWPRRMRAAPLAGILRVGVPASLGTIVNYVGMMVLTIVMTRLGTAELAAFGLGSRFDFVLLTLCYGTGVAVLTLVGFASGARRLELVRAFARHAIVVMTLAVGALSAVLFVAPDVWFGLFTDDPAIRGLGRTYFRIVGLSYPPLVFSMTLAFAFQGLGRGFLPLSVLSLRVAVVVIGALVLTGVWGAGMAPVLWLIPAAQVLSAILLAIAFFRATAGKRRDAAST
jgi:Na+-driven multidrug efflux pump